MSTNTSGNSRTFGIEITPSRLIAVALKNGDKVSLFQAERVESADPPREIAEFVQSAVEKFGECKAIGVAVPGLIDPISSRVAHSVRMPENMDIDFRSLFSQIGLHVRLENDANAAAFGEYLLGAGRGAGSMFYATIDVGVGGSFIFDGKIWRGSAGFAGEFGYVAINEDGLRLEDVASVENIVRRTRERFNRDSTSSLGKMQEEEIGIDEIISAANEGDDLAVLMLARTGNYIGTAIASVINLLNVEKIVLGGKVMHAGGHILDSITQRASELSFEPAFSATKIVLGELGIEAAATGAALLASAGDLNH
jgi:glucokinase